MSTFFCFYCDELKDGDFDGCCEVPGHSYENACESCDAEKGDTARKVSEAMRAADADNYGFLRGK